MDGTEKPCVIKHMAFLYGTQERIVIDAFRLWQSRKRTTRFVELPWFGVSHFYMGIQLADLVAYLHHASDSNQELAKLYQKMAHKVQLATIP